MALKQFQELEDKRPNIIKGVPMALTIQEIPRALGAVSQEPGTVDRKPKYIFSLSVV